MLNVRSLRKHTIDVVNDFRLLQSDILCLTESQIPLEYDCEDISSMFSNHHLHFNNSQHKYESLAFCFHNEVVLLSHYMMPGSSLIAILKPSFSRRAFRLLLIYRSPSSNKSQFFDKLEKFLNSQKEDIDIILGDFNINAADFDHEETSSCLSSSYNLIVNEPTHLSGSVLDHIYVNKKIFKHLKYDVNLISVNFTDHDAVSLKLSDFHLL